MAQADGTEPTQAEVDEIDQAARDAFPCPECTAGRSELCRTPQGEEVPTHPSRIERYAREVHGVDLSEHPGPGDA